MAVEKGQDELAREALTRKKAYEDNCRNMKAQLDAQTKASNQLKSNMTYALQWPPSPSGTIPVLPLSGGAWHVK